MIDDGTRSSFRTIATLALIPIAGLALFFLWQWIQGGESPRETYQEAVPRVPRSSSGSSGSSAAVVPPKAAPRNSEEPRGTPRNRTGGGNIVLIIDDLGFDGQPLDRVMALDPNINCSILPNGTRAEEFARRLHARGFEILCHLPMQPRGNETPGRNAILTSMSDDEIAQLTRENVEAIPHARGVNNHMGSLATADRRVMKSVISAMPEGMYFIDSRTAGNSIAADVAREHDVPTATRHVFLDDVATETAVQRQLAELAESAQRNGTAIGIGHPYPVTLRVLARELPELRARGFKLVRASEVVR